MIFNEDTIIVGVSGGPDSMCLLNILYNLRNRLGINIVVAHVNHMIREEAEKETSYVKEFCDKKGIKCYIKYIDVKKIAQKYKISDEEAGRVERYKFFEEIFYKEDAKRIATAHNQNDNVETVLMNIIRGSGVSGLKGIGPIRNGKIIRPLINIKRSKIEKYCEDNKLEPKFDKTNNENVYTRNKVRNLLIPFLEKEFNPNIMEAINKLSDLATDDNDYVDRQVVKAFNEVLVEENNYSISLNLKKFNVLDNVIKKRLVLYTISKLVGSAKDIEKIHVNDIIKLCGNNIGNKFLTPKKHIKVTIKSKKIFFEKVI
ncbi:MAG: tRNA lysidine(34) synthetase TilS [Clostridia bacterium]|nr:tRNA lysidine(34) synthetase TilS [Clostridia bacterium]